MDGHATALIHDDMTMISVEDILGLVVDSSSDSNAGAECRVAVRADAGIASKCGSVQLGTCMVGNFKTAAFDRSATPPGDETPINIGP